MAEGEGGGVIGAERRPGSDEEWIRVLAQGEGDDLVEEVFLVLQVTPGALGGMEVPAVPALDVHLFDAEELQMAVLEVPAQRGDEAAVLPVVEGMLGGGEGEEARAGVA